MNLRPFFLALICLSLQLLSGHSFAQTDTLVVDTETLIGYGEKDANGQRHGLWKFYYDNRKLQSEGKYEHGKVTGPWVNYYKTGGLYFKGRHENDLNEGIWQTYDTLGRLIQESVWVKGKQTGKVKSWNFDAQEIWLLELKDSKPHGKATAYHMIDPKTMGYKKVEGQHTNGKMEGRWTWYHPNGKISYTGRYRNHLQQGEHISYAENGRITQTVVYKDGKPVK